MRTRPKISWSDLRHATVGVWGVGVEGRANLRRLGALGATAVVVDDRPAVAGVDGRPVTATAAGGLDALRRCEVVVKSPGVSRYRPDVGRLEAAGVAVVGGLGLWMEEVDRSRVACVTGTKGKSTTTSIAAHLLRRLGHDVLAGGNLGLPPWDPAAGDRHDLWVVETSSFQATDLASSPPVVAVTSLHPDHLDWHGDAPTYFADKLSASSQPGAALTIADGRDPLLRAHAALLGGRVHWVNGEDPPGAAWAGSLGLRGGHNLRNALVARQVLAALGVPGADDDQVLAEAAAGYTGLPSRLERIGSAGGVDFVDDSLSTNVLSAVAALAAFPDRRVALLVGGHDRGIDYADLGAAVARRPAPTLVVTMPESGPRIGAAVVAAGGPTGAVVDRGGLADAAREGWEWARPDGVVLLSPASPSFGAFRDYRDRAEAFAAVLGSCAAAAAG
jgi:UDP-N-acetylmuramoylalanine--D-glutamate ligase